MYMCDKKYIHVLHVLDNPGLRKKLNKHRNIFILDVLLIKDVFRMIKQQVSDVFQFKLKKLR